MQIRRKLPPPRFFRQVAAEQRNDRAADEGDENSSGVYIYKSVVNYLKHFNYICKSEGNYLQSNETIEQQTKVTRPVLSSLELAMFTTTLAVVAAHAPSFSLIYI